MTFRSALALVAALAAPVAPVAAQDIRTGTLTLSAAWSRATAPRASVGAGYVVIRNTGTLPDRLIAASTPRADRIEVHSMSMAGGVMRMRPMSGGLAVPAGGAVRLEPGGHHLMLLGLKAPLRPGERIPVTLRFARAGAVQLRFAVLAAGAAGPAGGHR